MKILFLTYEVTDRGGNFIRCFSLAKNLVKFHHQVTLIAGNPRPSFRFKKYQKEGVKIIEAPCFLPFRIRHNGTSPIQIITRSFYLLNHRFDVIHGFGHRPTVIIPSLFHRLIHKKPYLADWADLWGKQGIAELRGNGLGSFIYYLDHFLEKYCYRLANHLTVINNYLKNKALLFKIPAQKITLIPVGADTDAIKPLSKRTACQQLKLNLNTPYVIFLGNAPYDEKLLGETFVNLSKINPKVKLIFLGAQMPIFNSIIKKHQLNQRLIHFGFIAHHRLNPYLACGDVMLLPYSNRSINLGRYPNKLGDYLASGRPIVTNPTGDLKLIFKNYSIGLTTKADPCYMAIAINKLLTHPQLKSKLGRNARKLAKSQLNWQQLAQKLEKLYLKV